MTAEDVIAALKLEPPHPEGGFFRQTFKDARTLVVDGKTRKLAPLIVPPL
jgi:predicted cupin superfamily sugar epimerase